MFEGIPLYQLIKFEHLPNIPNFGGKSWRNIQESTLRIVCIYQHDLLEMSLCCPNILTLVSVLFFFANALAACCVFTIIFQPLNELDYERVVLCFVGVGVYVDLLVIGDLTELAILSADLCQEYSFLLSVKLPCIQKARW